MNLKDLIGNNQLSFQGFFKKERHTPYPCQKGFRSIFRSQKGGPNITVNID